MIGFIIPAHKDAELARASLESLRRVYPLSPVVIVTDGDDDPVWDEVASAYGTGLVRGEWLFATSSGGAFTRRILEAGLSLNCDYVFRTDTDSLWHREFRVSLPKDVVFGCLQTTAQHLSVQGGITGICSSVIPKLLSFDYETLKDYARTWASGSPDLMYRAEVQGLTSWDWTLGYMCRRLGVPMVSYSDIGSGWKSVPAGNFACTHPHKITSRRCGQSLPA